MFSMAAKWTWFRQDQVRYDQAFGEEPKREANDFANEKDYSKL